MKFKQIKQGKYFIYQDRKWKRTHGRWAIPVDLIGQGFSGFYFDLETPVRPC